MTFWQFKQWLKFKFGKPKPGYIREIVIESTWKRVSIYKGAKVYREQADKVSEIERNLFAARWLEAEVKNGGFGQFYSNPTGVVVHDAIKGYETIGMKKTSILIASTKEKKSGAKGADDEFYGLIDKENGGFDKAADQYVLDNLKALNPFLRWRVKRIARGLKLI
ncbi:MAG TPA: DUF4375 domain-containing protein [bacterium]|nr:DUF4375 domain-containing protein [bacterium]